MEIRARVQNSYGAHRATLMTNGADKALAIPPGVSGFGSSANGGELLFLALATCYCNDIYREAATRGITVQEVTVDVAGQFGAPGEAATGVTYHARVVADATEGEIAALMRHTDTVAEIQNTLRVPIDVTLAGIEAVSSRP
jgi:organic hydroperoxide reductase OsmC/OhrA